MRPPIQHCLNQGLPWYLVGLDDHVAFANCLNRLVHHGRQLACTVITDCEKDAPG